MCAIAFIINYNKQKKLNLELVESLYDNMEARGKDASGFYFERKEKEGRKTKTVRRLKKAPVPTQELWELTQIAPQEGQTKEDFEKFKLNGTENLIILHARAMTQGDAKDNNNNHPIFSQNYVLVHNGIVDDLKPISRYPYKGLVDSEHILARIETYGITEGLKGLIGDMAIIFKRKFEDGIYLCRNFNPLEIIWFPEEQIMIGISDDNYVSIPDEFWAFSKIIFRPGHRIESLPKDWLYKISTKEPKILLAKELIVREIDYNTKADVKAQEDGKKSHARNIQKWLDEQYDKPTPNIGARTKIFN